MRARCLLWACVLLFACRRGTLSGDGGTGVIAIDGGAGDARARDATVVDARAVNAAWSPWPMADHDPANTRRSPYVGPQAPVNRVKFDLPGGLVIGGDGTLYATDWGDKDPIVAIEPRTGVRLWSFAPTPSVPTTVSPFSPTIAVGPEGNIYAAYQQGAFYALARDGSVRWQFTTGKTGPSGDLSVFSAPLVDAGGRVYVGEGGVIYAFESDGRRAWQYDTHALPGARPRGIAADGTVYAIEDFGALHALDRNGTRLWTLPTAPMMQVFGGLVVRADGALLFATLGDMQFGAVSADGAVLWKKRGELSGLTLGSDGAAYGADRSGILRLDRDGATVWQAIAGGQGAIVDAAGTVYCGEQGGIAAVDASGVLKWEIRTADPAIPGSALSTPTLLAIAADGTLYAAINVEIHAIGGGGLCEGKPVDCDDHDPCTVDRCDPQAGCVHAPKCVSPGPCTSAACGPDGTCSFAAAADGIACDDGIACSQGDACRSGQCVAPSSACALSGAWPATAHDGQHTNATSLLGPAAPTLKWASPVPGAGVFVIAGDGTIFASDGQRLQTIDNDGVAAPLATVPAIDLMLRQDGGLYATTAETTTMLQALGADGALQWTLDATPISAPVIGPSGAIYTETRRDLRAFAPDGSTAWAIPTGGGFAPPAVGLDGTVYAPAPDLWAIAADGRVKWKRPVGWARGLVVGPTGTTYAMLDGSVRATDANGADVWSFTGSSDAPLAPALSPGGDLILVVGSTFYRLDAASGRVRSTLTPPAPANTYQHLASPIIDGNDVLYVIANAEDSNSFQPQTRVTVYAVDRTDKVLWTAELAHAFGASGRALAIGPERTLYVTVSGSLYAIGP